MSQNINILRTSQDEFYVNAKQVWQQRLLYSRHRSSNRHNINTQQKNSTQKLHDNCVLTILKYHMSQPYKAHWSCFTAEARLTELNRGLRHSTQDSHSPTHGWLGDSPRRSRPRVRSTRRVHTRWCTDCLDSTRGTTLRTRVRQTHDAVAPSGFPATQGHTTLFIQPHSPVNHTCTAVFHRPSFLQLITITTRMWANAQRDGRPAEYRWRPLFNAAKFGWCPLPECRAVTLSRRKTRWNLQGCPKLANRS